MALEMRTACERCGAALAPDDSAAICSFELMVMNDVKALYNQILASHRLAPIEGSLFDVSYRSPDVVFQSSVPGFAYPRREHNPKIQFVGALLPYKAAITTVFSQREKLDTYKRVILISQGTVDNKNPRKLIVPALEALKDTDALLMVTTMNSGPPRRQERHPRTCGLLPSRH